MTNFFKAFKFFMTWRWLFQPSNTGKKNRFFLGPEANMKFKTMIFGGKELQIGTYKPPVMIWAGISCTPIRNPPKLRSWSKTVITLKTQKIAVIQAKFIFYRKSRFFQNWRVETPNFIRGLTNLSEVVSSPIEICSRWLTLWENRLFDVKNRVFYVQKCNIF